MPASTPADPSRPVARPRMWRSAVGGFTLIELMITVAVVAILAAVAMPSYQSYIRKGNRADGTSLLQAASLAQEKHRLGNISYTADTTKLSPPCPTSGTCKSERQHYSLSATGSATGYTLTATPTSSLQSADTDCNPITLTVAGGTTTYGPNKCWGK